MCVPDRRRTFQKTVLKRKLERMLAAVVSDYKNIHEVVSAFQLIGFPLHKTLVSMLNEDPEHQRPRRGCGFTQAGRFLAKFINSSRGLGVDQDLALFSEAGQNNILALMNEAQIISGRLPRSISEIRCVLGQAPIHNSLNRALFSQLCALENLPQELRLEESRLIVNLILSILGSSKILQESPALPFTPADIAVGTCPEAERYFLEFAGNYLRRQGLINVLTDNAGQVLMVEKINIGDSHSCITVRDLVINKVVIPAGSLVGAKYSSMPISTELCAELKGAWAPISICDGFKFLRLTTLSVSPANRSRAFKNHLLRQLEGSPFFDPLNTRLSDLVDVAELQRPAKN